MNQQLSLAEIRALTKRERAVFNILLDGQWHPGHELTQPHTGGSEGLRRLRELRAKGHTIEMKKDPRVGVTTRYYRLVTNAFQYKP